MRVSERGKTALVCIALAVAVCVLYGQVANHPFIQFDDKYYVSMNPHVNTGFSVENIVWSFKFSQIGERSYWHPVAWVSHMLDCQLFGLNAGMHHLSNVLYHILNAILLFLALRLMTGSLWRSAFAASLFALHPVNVETVAWIAERKNLVSTAFWLLTTIAYWFYTKKPGIWRYILVAALFCLGLITKPMLMTLPFTLLLLDYWPLGRIQLDANQNAMQALLSRKFKKLVLEKIPLILMSCILGYLTIHSLAVTDQILASQVTMGLKVENAIVSYAMYLAKMIWPTGLTIFHPFPAFVPMSAVVISLAVLFFITSAAALTYRKRPYFIVGWLWFLGTLVTVSGIVQGGLWPAYAERWAYVPYIGMFITISWGVPDLLNGVKHRALILSSMGAAALVALSMVTWTQIGYWKDDVTLFSRGIALHPINNQAAHFSLAAHYLDGKDYPGALRHYTEALEDSPGNPFILNDTGMLLVKMGRTDEAIRSFQEAIRSLPTFLDAKLNMGNLLLKKGDPDSAIEQYLQIVQRDPGKTKAYYNLGLAYEQKSDPAKAAESFRKALQTQPGYTDAQKELSRVEGILSRYGSASDKLEREIHADPGNPALYIQLAGLKVQEGKTGEAAAAYEKALSIKPDSEDALYGKALMHAGRQEYAQAIALLQTMRKLHPEKAEIYYNIACLYARWNKPEEAVSWLKQAVGKGFRNLDLIRKDPDLASVRNTPFVKELLDQGNQRLPGTK